MKALNKVTFFIILTFAISFSMAGIYFLADGDKAGTVQFTLLGAAYMFAPMISAIVVKKFIYHEKLSDLLISFKINKWFVVGWLIMPILAFGTLGISLLMPNINYSPDFSGMFQRFESMMTPEQLGQMKNSIDALPVDPILIILFQGLFAGITINGLAGFGEELGWRGFLLTEFKNMSFLKASIIIGLIWGIWHAPLILMGHNYPQHPKAGVFMMTAWCIFLTPVFIYITIKAKSVIATAILHGTLNATAGIAIMKIEGGNDLTSGVTGIAGFIALFVLIIIMWLYDTFVSKEKILQKTINKSLDNNHQN